LIKGDLGGFKKNHEIPPTPCERGASAGDFDIQMSYSGSWILASEF
jgi:hypothetical protein